MNCYDKYSNHGACDAYLLGIILQRLYSRSAILTCISDIFYLAIGRVGEPQNDAKNSLG
jgi:hypothetical protein